MRKVAVVLGLLAMVGCAGDEPPTPRERLIGVWAREINADCAAAYVFGADDIYDFRLGCFNGASFEMELYSGAWSTDGERVRFEPVGASCPAEIAGGLAEPWSTRYALDDGDRTLRIVNAEGATEYERHEDDGMPSEGGSSIRFGCYMSDGFEPRAFERF